MYYLLSSSFILPFLELNSKKIIDILYRTGEKFSIKLSNSIYGDDAGLGWAVEPEL